MSVIDIVDAIESVLPARRPIEHHEPCINGKETAYVMQAMIDGVANDHWVKRFEKQIAEYCGVDLALGVSSGTAALHLALMAAGVNPGEEVLVPTLTFAATANAVCHAGAIPHFVDANPAVQHFKLRNYLERNTKHVRGQRGTLNSKTKRVISAIIVVDLLGFPADWPKLTKVADDFGLVLIEDAAQALGSSLGNQRCGSYGAVSTLSFNNNKIATGNGGGALLTNDEWIWAKATQLATTARLPHPWKVEHDAVAWNYRMHSITAALATAQLEQMDVFLDKKQQLLEHYHAAMVGVAGVKMLTPVLSAKYSQNNWLVPLELMFDFVGLRDELLETLHSKGIRARAMFTPLHQLPQFAECPQDRNLLYAERCAKSVICLPSGAGLL